MRVVALVFNSRVGLEMLSNIVFSWHEWQLWVLPHLIRHNRESTALLVTLFEGENN